MGRVAGGLVVVEARHMGHRVFAVCPSLGLIAGDFLESSPNDGFFGPVWYQCLLPPKASDGLLRWNLRQPKATLAPGRRRNREPTIEGNAVIQVTLLSLVPSAAALPDAAVRVSASLPAGTLEKKETSTSSASK